MTTTAHPSAKEMSALQEKQEASSLTELQLLKEETYSNIEALKIVRKEGDSLDSALRSLITERNILKNKKDKAEAAAINAAFSNRAREAERQELEKEVIFLKNEFFIHKNDLKELREEAERSR